ncbi:MAG: NAD(P)/FAD-dependent oxidoreductase [Betaproteobacteria bacterium]
MKPDYDIIVIGAGPAGAEAAIKATALGLSVLVLDEARAAGGLVYRAPDADVTSAEPEGDALRARLAVCGADIAFDHRVWHVAQVAAPDGQPPRFEIAAVGPQGLVQAQAAALIVATGVVERFYPRPGWTLPGVIGLGAATVMLKSQRLLPGKRVVVAGPGPLAPLVANLIIRGGGKVAALIDPNPLGAWFAAMPGVARRPGLMAQGSTWLARLVVKGVPAYRGWDVRRIDGTDGVETVTVGPVDAKWRPVAGAHEKTITADAVCLGYGLTPAAEIYRLLGAEERHDGAAGGWVPVLDAGRRTSIGRLYGAGDGAGLEGAAAAPLTGRIAALSAALDLGRLDTDAHRREQDAATHELSRAARFGRAMSRLIAPKPTAMERVPDDTIVCRCEDVTAGALRAEVAAGAREINAVKAATRCGMGPCGGRMCADAMAATIECAGVPFAEIGRLTARTPLRPVPLDSLTGSFEYSDIPLPDKLDT